MWIIESVDLKEHFVHQNFPIHLTMFFITTSWFSTTVLFSQNATLSNNWIGIAFFAIRNTNKIAWRTLTLLGGVRKGESCFFFNLFLHFMPENPVGTHLFFSFYFNHLYTSVTFFNALKVFLKLVPVVYLFSKANWVFISC